MDLEKVVIFLNFNIISNEVFFMEMILKSSSPRRNELLKKYNKPFTVKVYDVDETMDPSKTPYENVKETGYKKAAVKKEEDYGKILIGCDTIVVLDGVIYGKPKNREDAFRMLKTFSGKVHNVMSGVAIIYKEHEYSFVVTSDVKFKELSDEDINNYLDTDEYKGKAGAYAIQGIGYGLVDYYKGSLDNIIGLPTEEVFKILGEIYGMED